jgi:hypothetical protein
MLPLDLLNTYESLHSLRQSNDEWRYVFMADDEFRELMSEDAIRASGVYWKEMLYRAHIVCLVSAFKTLRWMESLDSTFENYYGFCASLRGLLESCADTFYTLRSVPLTLAKDFFVIKEQIGQRSSVLTTHASLEDLLIHYIQATKLSHSQSKQYPDSFRAKTIKEYLSAMDDEDLNKLYQWLCGISHPAYEATKMFLFLHKGQTIVCNDSFDMEKVMIRDILQFYTPALSRMMRSYMNNLVSVLLVLNELGIDSLTTAIGSELVFKQTDIWKEIHQYMNESEHLYQQRGYESET